MTMLLALTEERDRAQNELASAEIALIEATAAAEVLREAVRRLDAAVAALSGAEPAAPLKPDFDPDSKEAFERKVRERQKAELAANPLANLRCNGCGVSGHIHETYLTAPSGASVHMLICGKCNNQMMK